MTPHDHGDNKPHSNHSHNHGSGHSHGHGHAHSHGHSHGYGHHHHDHRSGSKASQKAILWALILNVTFAVIQLVGGLLSNSVAVLSNAFHDFGDALALAVALVLERVSAKQADSYYSYGYRRWSLVSALWTGGILIAGTIWIWIESIERLNSPEPVQPEIMLLMAVLGVVINAYSWYRMSKGSSLNEEMLSWHFIEDMLGWVLVLGLSVVLYFMDWFWLDSVVAMGLSLWISYNVSKRFIKVGSLFLQRTPDGVEIPQVEKSINQVPGVKAVHHTHIWSVDGQDHILTTHVVLTEAGWAKMIEVKSQIKLLLQKEFNVIEATIEFESPEEACAAPHH